MIRVQIIRDRRGRIRSFSVKGHAGFAEHGRDILCAAISSLVQNGINAPEALLGVPIPASSEEGRVEANVPVLPPEMDEKVQLLLESMVYGIRAWAQEYPRHVQVKDTVVDEGGDRR